MIAEHYNIGIFPVFFPIEISQVCLSFAEITTHKLCQHQSTLVLKCTAAFKMANGAVVGGE